MLHAETQIRTGLAWLHDGEYAHAIRISGRSDRPEPGRLTFFAPDFALSEKRPYLVGERAQLTPKPLLGNRLPLPHLDSKAEPSPAEFHRLMEDLENEIAAGPLQKAVPMIREELEFAAPVHAEMFSAIHTLKYERQYSYGFEFEGEGMCGVTPELLFSVDRGILKTMALAGTGPAAGPSLLDDPKEMNEHEFVLENLRRVLGAYGEVDFRATEEKTFGPLKHLRTKVEVRLSREVSFPEIVRVLHPTAALGGWPRQAAWDWLEKQKFHLSRKRFGAPFGFADGERMICVVAIRGIQWHGRKAWLSAGCGVVRESKPDREWNELQLKMRAVRDLLGMET